MAKRKFPLKIQVGGILIMVNQATAVGNYRAEATYQSRKIVSHQASIVEAVLDVVFSLN